MHVCIHKHIKYLSVCICIDYLDPSVWSRCQHLLAKVFKKKIVIVFYLRLKCRISICPCGPPLYCVQDWAHKVDQTRDVAGRVYTHKYVCVCIYIYIYVYIEREGALEELVRHLLAHCPLRVCNDRLGNEEVASARHPRRSPGAAGSAGHETRVALVVEVVDEWRRGWHVEVVHLRRVGVGFYTILL